MRICVFNTQYDVTGCNQLTARRKLRSASIDEKAEIVCLATFPWTKEGDNADDTRVVSQADRAKMRICFKLLQVIAKNRWIPSRLEFFIVQLCKKELLEGLLGSDPDVIVALDPFWEERLRRLVKKAYPQWLCLASTDCVPKVNQHWRKYDPSAKVSIVLPTYNGSRYIRCSIESCLTQTHSRFELLVVDDGSAPQIREIVQSYSDSRIRYIRHETNRGLSAALNTGFKNSTGDYLTWTSDDNYYAPDALEEMLRFLQTYRDIDFVYADTYIIDERCPEANGKIWRVQSPAGLKIDNTIGPCFLYKRKVYEIIGEYDPRFFLAEDYDYWLRVSKVFRMQRLFRTLYYYRLHANSLTGRHGREQVLEKVETVKRLSRTRLVGHHRALNSSRR